MGFFFCLRGENCISTCKQQWKKLQVPSVSDQLPPVMFCNRVSINSVAVEDLAAFSLRSESFEKQSLYTRCFIFKYYFKVLLFFVARITVEVVKF